MLKSYLPKFNTREEKVNVAFTGLFAAGTAATVLSGGLTLPLLGVALVRSAAWNVVGAEATKSFFNWLDTRGKKNVQGVEVV